jgi:hypothetical protein
MDNLKSLYAERGLDATKLYSSLPSIAFRLSCADFISLDPSKRFIQCLPPDLFSEFQRSVNGGMSLVNRRAVDAGDGLKPLFYGPDQQEKCQEIATLDVSWCDTFFVIVSNWRVFF